MDGNRRYARKKKLKEGAGHDSGALALLYMLVFCYELGVKHLTAYAFSIDNFTRTPEEAKKVMDLMMKCIAILTRITENCPVRVHIAGNLQLVTADLRDAAERLMEATAHSSKLVLTICIADACTDAILHAVQESCEERCDRIQEIRGIDHARNMGDSHLQGREDLIIKLVDIEKHTCTSIAPDPDILIRTSGECRLSNFLLWQTCRSHLSSLSTVWPAFGFWNLVCVVLNFQRNHSYFEKKNFAAFKLAHI